MRLLLKLITAFYKHQLDNHPSSWRLRVTYDTLYFCDRLLAPHGTRVEIVEALTRLHRSSTIYTSHLPVGGE